MLWYTPGTITALLQEVVAIYPALSPPTLTVPASNRVCNALALLQCVASHAETRALFLGAHIPLYLYSFLSTSSRNKPFEYLRLTSLGVIGALVKMDDADVVKFLLQTEVIPLCLRIMETGTELSKTVRGGLHTWCRLHFDRPVTSLHLPPPSHPPPRAGCHLHCAKDPAGRPGPAVRVRHRGPLLCRLPRAGEHGARHARIAVAAPAEAHHPVLPAAGGQPARARRAAAAAARGAA